MKNPIIAKLIENNLAEISGDRINLGFSIDEKIFLQLDVNDMKAEFYFDSESGKLNFEKVLGRDENNDFYNEENGNLNSRKEAIKVVIVNVLVNIYNNL